MTNQEKIEIALTAIKQLAKETHDRNILTKISTTALILINDHAPHVVDDNIVVLTKLITGLEICSGIGAVNLQPRDVRDVATKILQIIQPQWAYEFGNDYFNDLPFFLLRAISRLQDTSWHNDSIASFKFGTFTDKDSEFHICMYLGKDEETSNLVFDFSLIKDGEPHCDLSLIEESNGFGLPSSNTLVSDGLLNTDFAHDLAFFIETYATLNIHPELENFIKEQELLD